MRWLLVSPTRKISSGNHPYASFGIWLQIKDLVAVGLDANCVLSWMSIYRVINKNGRQQLLKVQFFVSNKFIIDRVFWSMTRVYWTHLKCSVWTGPSSPSNYLYFKYYTYIIYIKAANMICSFKDKLILPFIFPLSTGRMFVKRICNGIIWHVSIQ